MRVVLAAFASIAIAGVSAGAAAAAQRVASTTGTANATCNAATPCDLATAIQSARSGDDVLIEAGDYGSPTAPLTHTITAEASNLTVHGPTGGPRPRIFFNTKTSNATVNGLEFAGAATTVRDLEVHNVSTQVGAQALFTNGGGSVIDHVVASTAGVTSTPPQFSPAVAIDATGSTTIVDTVAYATSKGMSTQQVSAQALLLQGFEPTNTDVVRDCTVIGAAGGSSFALDAHGENGSTTVTLQNTIVQQGGNALDVREETGATITINADHDAISGELTFSGTYNTGPGMTLAAPAFADAAANDYHEAANSTATIDKGAPAGAGDPATDLDGDLRTIGAAPDIGADERPGSPSAAITGTSGVGTDHATVSGSVTAGGGVSRAWLDYGTTTAYGQRTAISAVAPTAARQPIGFALTGLASGTTYHARITVVNQAGTVRSADATFTTVSQPGGGGNTPATVHQTGTGAAASRSGKTYRFALPVTVSCPAHESCQVQTTITVAAATAAAKHKHAAKPIVIGTARSKVAGGRRTKPSIKLNRAGARLLRAHHRLKAFFALKVLAGPHHRKTRKSGKVVIAIKAHKPF